VSAEFYLQYRERSKLLQDVSTYNSYTSTLRAGDRVERIRMSWPTNSLFTTLGASPILGRLPPPEDEDRVVVISDALWQSWFGGDPNLSANPMMSPEQSARSSASWAPSSGFQTMDPALDFQYTFTAGDYFKTIGIHVISGRSKQPIK
jgi:hypothetical protein